LWFLADDPERLFRDRLVQVVRGARRMLGFLPTGLGPKLPSEKDVPITSVYWSLRGDGLAGFRRAGIATWKDDVRSLLAERHPDLAERAEPLLAQIVDVDQVPFALYHDVEMDHWHHDRVVFLGDAAHAMSPQLGQGCNLALFDALVLAECVHAHVSREPSDLDRALEAYSARRQRHLRTYTQATRWLTPFFQGDWDGLADLRDLFMGPFGKLPFVAKMMTASMAGILGSWAGTSIALPARTSEMPGVLPLAQVTST
jgi:2-polyprenyl-6-methoxyphenol hydroxylase-like FAD-dependent oxidoreductase